MVSKKSFKSYSESQEEFNKIEKRVRDLFSHQTFSSIKEALKLCETYGIDSKQFELYYLPEESNSDSRFYSKESEQKLEDKKETFEEKNDKQTNSSLNEQNKTSILFHENFPFKENELHTLSSQSLVNIINGCFSSYGSREIIRVFNTREYLGKMAGITNLKQQPVYLRKIHYEIIENKKGIDSAFDEFIKYLDNLAYNSNRWTIQTKNFGKDTFSTSKNAQKERIMQIPEIEKAKFIESIISKPIDLVRNHNYIHNRQPIGDLMANTKTGYVAFLMKQLQHKWNNQDIIK